MMIMYTVWILGLTSHGIHTIVLYYAMLCYAILYYTRWYDTIWYYTYIYIYIYIYHSLSEAHATCTARGNQNTRRENLASRLQDKVQAAWAHRQSLSLSLSLSLPLPLSLSREFGQLSCRLGRSRRCPSSSDINMTCAKSTKELHMRSLLDQLHNLVTHVCH